MVPGDVGPLVGLGVPVGSWVGPGSVVVNSPGSSLLNHKQVLRSKKYGK